MCPLYDAFALSKKQPIRPACSWRRAGEMFGEVVADQKIFKSVSFVRDINPCFYASKTWWYIFVIVSARFVTDSTERRFLFEALTAAVWAVVFPWEWKKIDNFAFLSKNNYITIKRAIIIIPPSFVQGPPQRSGLYSKEWSENVKRGFLLVLFIFENKSNNKFDNVGTNLHQTWNVSIGHPKISARPRLMHKICRRV